MHIKFWDTLAEQHPKQYVHSGARPSSLKMVLGPAASIWPEILLEMHYLRTHADLLSQEAELQQAFQKILTQEESENHWSRLLSFPWWKWKCESLSRVQLFVTPRTVARHAPLSMGFSRQEYWSGYSGDLPDPGLEPASLMSPALAGGYSTTCAPWKPPLVVNTYSLYLEKRSP